VSVKTRWGICVVDIAPHLPYSIKSSLFMDIVHPATIKQIVLLERMQMHVNSKIKWSLVA
jgi:hypothetical protein